jgi:hypothetical protein
MKTPIEKGLGYGAGGWYVEWTQEDTQAPMGFRAAYWYGMREACVKRMAQRPPCLRPLRSDGAPPYDAATATGMYGY